MRKKSEATPSTGGIKCEEKRPEKMRFLLVRDEREERKRND